MRLALARRHRTISASLGSKGARFAGAPRRERQLRALSAKLRCQSRRRCGVSLVTDLAKHGQNVASDYAFDAFHGFAAATAVILEIVSHGAGDGIGRVGLGAIAGGKALLMGAPQARRALRLGKIQNCLAAGILQVVGEARLGFAINSVLVTPARDPTAAGRAPAAAEMQNLLDHAPVRLAGEGKGQARATRGKRSFTDCSGHDPSRKFLPSFCLISVGKPPRTSTIRLNETPWKI
jgi:hypothetical protein